MPPRGPAAVIGMWWGDEGKGRVVDWLAREAGGSDAAVIVRYNGGAQAAHTVCLPTGLRHIFSHFGSGGLAGCPTYLAAPFVCNPAAYLAERKLLRRRCLGAVPPVIVHPDCRVTIPTDIAIGQAIEIARGDSRHGSCGLGIHETLLRHSTFPLCVRDLLDSRHAILAKLERIAKYYVPRRSCSLEIPGVPMPTMEFQMELSMAALDIFAQFIDSIRISDERFLADPQRRLIFEGAQGVQLCETNLAAYPHLTPSRPGLDNIIPTLNQIGIRNLEVFMVSRAYTTRHGAGPFPLEISDLSYPDLTNVPNPWQGQMRFGRFDCLALHKTALAEAEKAKSLATRWNLVITCLDQADRFPIHGIDGDTDASPAVLLDNIASPFLSWRAPLHHILFSCSPCGPLHDGQTPAKAAAA